MPTSIPLVIPTVICRVGAPVNSRISPVGLIPIGSVVGDRRLFPVSIQPMHPPAPAILVAGDIGFFGSLGFGNRRRHRDCARNGEKRTQSKCSVKRPHVLPLFAASPTAFPWDNERGK